MARGILAEINRAVKAADRESQRQHRESVRRYNAAVKEAERRRKAQERAAAQLARATEAERKRLEKEAKAAYVAAKEAEAEQQNFELAEVYDEIDSILAATLDVDDYVDLNAMRAVVEHPPFNKPELEVPTPPPEPVPDPPKPQLRSPKAPKGLGALLGKKRHEKAVAKAASSYEQAVSEYKTKAHQAQAARKEAKRRHATQDAKRLKLLKAARDQYDQECFEREIQVQEQNKEIDTLIANLGYGDADAVQEYVSIVLSNSVYPPHFQVDHEFKFEPSTAELQLKVVVPSPETLPTVKAYKYNKAQDEIKSTALSQKACKDRYAGAMDQVALRSIHEIFEADRREVIKTISLEVGAETTSPATGLRGFIRFVATGAERDSFIEIDLANVVASATLAYLGASVSKNPFGLVEAKSSGVRRS